LESKNTSKNVFFPALTFDLNRAQSDETASEGPKTLPAQKLIVACAMGSGELDALDGQTVEGRLTGKIQACADCLEPGKAHPNLVR
jgi:hypothetical protein